MADKTPPRKRASSGGQARRPKKPVNARRLLMIGWASGLVMGLFVALMVHLEHTRPETPDTDAKNPSNEPASASAEDDGPRFEFYRLLSEQEVEVATQESGAVDNAGALPSLREQDGPAADQDASDSTPAGDTERYLLQAGSFRQADDADALRANLALLGIEARIQTVELPGGETWHRVRIGPFSSLESVNTVRQRMAGQAIDAILLRGGGG